jgi:hypothetical protein
MVSCTYAAKPKLSTCWPTRLAPTLYHQCRRLICGTPAQRLEPIVTHLSQFPCYGEDAFESQVRLRQGALDGGGYENQCEHIAPICEHAPRARQPWETDAAAKASRWSNTTHLCTKNCPAQSHRWVSEARLQVLEVVIFEQ